MGDSCHDKNGVCYEEKDFVCNFVFKQQEGWWHYLFMSGSVIIRLMAWQQWVHYQEEKKEFYNFIKYLVEDTGGTTS